MKHIGIITEFNPFHNGHAHLIQSAKKKFPDKKIICIMSGDYVQRGEPAIFNKYLRTECALTNGCDVLLELPGLFASASAEHFASAAVLALASTNLVDTLCFGVENNQLDTLKEIAHYLVLEPESYKTSLKQELSNGSSFAKARAKALSEHFSDTTYTELIKKPNNILAIEYLKAIEFYHLPIKAVPISRIGAHYHDTNLDTTICSASALRHAIYEKQITSFDSIREYMPGQVHLLLQNHPAARPLFFEDFFPFLQYALHDRGKHYTNFVDVSNDFSNKLQSYLTFPSDFDCFLQELSGKHISTARIRRCLLNIMLQHTKEQLLFAKDNKYISYLRLLGFHSDAAFLLKELKKTSTVPIIQKVSNAAKVLPPNDLPFFEHDIWRSHLYNQVFQNKYGISLMTEYEHSVIIR